MDAKGLRRWIKTALPGEPKIYHAGLLSADRVKNPVLDELAQTIAVLQETRFLAASQYRQATPIRDVWVYVVTRTGHGYAPNGLITGKISAREYSAIYAIINRDPDISVARAIRDACNISDTEANAILARMRARNLVTIDDGTKPKITDAAIRLVT